MKTRNSFVARAFLSSAAIPIALLIIGFLPSQASACACGCGIFDVGMSSGLLMPIESDSGFAVWARYSYMNQDQNWAGTSSASAADNHDKQLKTSFFTPGGQYMVNRSWSVMAELPMFDRALTTTDDGTVNGPAGSFYTGRMFDIGDLMIQGMYTGFAEDLSTGVSFGVKLPTGNYTGPIGSLGGAELDRDSLPGTGSTDLLIGAYHVGTLTANQSLNYFVQGRYQFAVATRNDYRPGNELDGALGLAYAFRFTNLGPLSRVTPVLQLLGSNRGSDSQANSDPSNSGYTRLIAAPGVELRFGKLRLFADLEIPVYQYTNAGDPTQGTAGQLVASVAYKVQLGYEF